MRAMVIFLYVLIKKIVNGIIFMNIAGICQTVVI